MAIRINTALIDSSNMELVPAGSHCVLDIKIDTRRALDVGILFYKNEADFDNLGAPYQPTVDITRYYLKLDSGEYGQLSVQSIHQLIQTYIETFLGPGSTEIIL